jgi:hypothetical protein
MTELTERERRAALERLLNPQMPNPFLRGDYGVFLQDLPPRRTLRERVRALGRRRGRD